ncbi:MAG: M23/M56 family metallopeptidase [Bacteroidota bacterium]
MSYLTEFLSHPALLHLGTWLLHFTWQAGLVGLLLWLAQPVLHKRSARVRYTTCWFALILMLALPTLTLVYPSALTTAPIEPVALPVAETSAGAHPSALPILPEAARHADNAFRMPALLTSLYQLRPYFVILWLLGVCVYAGTFQRGLARTHLLKHTGTPCREDTIARMMRRIADQMGILQRVVVRITDHIDQPVLIGWIKPVILLPAGMLTGLAPQQVEAILTHELAHIKRHDYALSVLQSVFETLFFFHPAVWWVSHRITIEREFCCDDLAVETMGSKATYLRALVTLETLRTTGLAASPALSMHDGSLLSRVRRLTTSAVSDPSPITRSRITLMFMLMFLLIASFVGNTSSADHTTPALLPSTPALIDAVVSNDSIPSLHPLKSKVKVTSGFGMRYHPVLKIRRMHAGVDFLARMGSDVYATAAGTIKEVAENNGRGKFIVIEHANGYLTSYSNLSLQSVKAGESIKKGQKIGESGNSGLSTGPHLHYEVRIDNKPVDPVDYLPSALLGQFEENDVPSIHPLGDNKIKATATYGYKYHPVLEIKRLHAGLDFQVASGSPVYATADGVVYVENRNGSYGEYIKLQHIDGFTTLYAHLSEIIVEAGEQLKKGDLLGYSGNTGLSSAPHLHYEIRLKGEALDPLYFLPEETIALSLHDAPQSFD